ncbi:hypothetical protein KIW84_044116 [Lathyrus oleraceus]|uniref:Pentatricopeptide repeat-containing protein n=1 Tax=Pisum sativum TaxID=3888 RepID=A0A9D4XJT8_PEA|nr:hypothetical protein KIW84_044116 [Pisum sativum]
MFKDFHEIIHLGKQGKVEEAKRVFSNVIHKNHATYNSMITVFAKNGRVIEAQKLFHKMSHRSIISWNTMIAGKLEKARELLELVPDRLDTACWNAMIDGYAKKSQFNDAEKNGKLSLAMRFSREDGGEEYCFLEFSYYSACANLAALQVGKQLHEFILKSGYINDLFVSNALIAMYAKCGRVESAEQMFKDISQVHITVRLSKMKLRNMHTLTRQKNEVTNNGVSYLEKYAGQQNNCNNGSEIKSSSKSMNQSICSVSLESPGPLHDIIICWIDQHVTHKGEGLKRLHIFVVELIRAGIFNPLAYVRQLIVSGIMDTSGNMIDLERQKRHSRILKQLPGNFICHALEESRIIEGPLLIEALHVYLKERRLILRGSFNENHDNVNSTNNSPVNKKHCIISTEDESSTVSINQLPSHKISYKVKKDDTSFEDLKTAISVLLQLPNNLSNTSTIGLGESQSSGKRPIEFRSKIDLMDVTPGCEECKRTKKLP